MMKRKRTKTAGPKQRKVGTALALTLHREWFDKIATGEKRVEYRAQQGLLANAVCRTEYKEVHFHNGYSATAPSLRVEYLGLRKYGSGQGSYFGIRLGRILETKHDRKQ